MGEDETTSRTPTTTTAATAGGGLGLGVLVVWLAGYSGLDMSAEVGAILGGLATGLGAAIATYGLVGIARRILFGAPKQ